MTIYIFVHIPRTGGTSLRAEMNRHFKGQVAVCGPGALSATGGGAAGDLAAAAALHPDAPAWAGHHPVGLHEHLGGYCEHITILRQPRARLASEIRRRVNSGRISDQTSLADFFERYPEQDNIACRLLSGDLQVPKVGRVQLHQAKVNLDRLFTVIGLTERLEGMWSSLPWTPGPLLHLNEGPALERDLPEIPDEVIRYDQELYDWAATFAM